MYLLGAEFRSRYIKGDPEYKILGDNFDPYDTSIYALALSLNNTIQSGESFMLGLYPIGTG